MYGGPKQKRKQARVKIDVPCEIKLINSKNPPVMGHLSDIDWCLSLQATAIFYNGDQVRISFELNKVKTEIIGSVLRTSGKTTTVVYGQLEPNVHSLVQDYIHKHYFDSKAK